MIRLTHLSGSLQGSSSTSPKAVVRIGRGADCDVRFDARLDARVSTHHAEIRFDDGHYVVVDTGSSNGTLVNGKQVRQQKLRSGDKIVFGAQGGPEVRFEIEDTFPGLGRNGSPRAKAPMGYAPSPAKGMDAAALAQEAQMKIAQARVLSGGQPSGQTMFIMADTLKKVEVATQKRDRKKTARIVLAVVAVAFLGLGAMGYVLWQKEQQLEKILHKKDNLDKQIQKIQLAMQIESDPSLLQQLEAQLTLLTGKAQAAIGELEQKDKTAAEKMAESGDELDRSIRRILRKFDADTYAVPPIFKKRLEHYIEQKAQNKTFLRQVYARKKAFWPIIVKEFAALGLPEEIAFVAWQESNFDPFVTSAAGARGMWQFMDFKAREFGMRVDPDWRKGGQDERTDVAKSTHAAAKYLYNLLSEFGSESFMLAIASYNKGEPGMRRALREVGFRKEQRDFWHLYRLKKLPEETMEYVPQILAAAILCNDPKKYGLE
ncbi:MAG: FHA domain-containing protein [Deltaproteobacteria bacterium]|nr:MAG: FHA domain-containing protein [Deltaproteobacteria bacterium]